MSEKIMREGLSDVASHIVEKFLVYHRENAHVFELFKTFAYQLKRSGLKHYGSHTILHRIRWHVSTETKGDDFKVNNNYASCYSRLMGIHDPFFKTFFRKRVTPGFVDCGEGYDYE